jgi:hypothetical protein
MHPTAQLETVQYKSPKYFSYVLNCEMSIKNSSIAGSQWKLFGVLGYSDPMMFLKALLHHSSTPALHGS